MTALDRKDKTEAQDMDWARMHGAGDLFGEIHLGEQASQAETHRSSLFPGLAVCSTAAAAAAWLSDHYGFPIILLGLIVGLALNFISADERTHKGLDFASRTCLRIGIVVLGLQVTFTQIANLGTGPFGALVVIMAVTIAAGMLGARLSGQSPYAGLLAGGATAICGASAALALYSVIGRSRLPQAQLALTLVGISLASAIAMSVYPVIAEQLGLSDSQAGFLIGASVHDVAQAIGGGYAFSNNAGIDATIVKLARVALLAPIVALASLALPPVEEGMGRKSLWRRLTLPWFITAFLVVMVLNSVVTFPAPVHEWGLTVSKAFLLLAVTATAMRMHVSLVMNMGWRAVVPVILATVASFGTALLFTIFLLDQARMTP